MKRTSVLLIASFLLLSLIPFGTINLAGPSGIDDLGATNPISVMTPSYMTFNQIIITSNSDLFDLVDANGWLGDGSETTPYRIQNLNITNTTYCIKIANVTDYFVISGCFLNSTTDSFETLELDNATHGTIEDTLVYGGLRGIAIHESHGAIIDNCTVADSAAEGIRLNQSIGCSLLDSEIFGNSDQGVNATSSDGLTIQGCEIHDNGQQGIQLVQTNYCEIHNNSVSNNNNDGLYLFQSHGCTVTDNEFYGHLDPVSDAGIYASSSSGGTASGNTVYDNRHSGIYLASSSNWEIHDNNIYSNVEDGVYGLNSHNVDFYSNNVSINNEAGGQAGVHVYTSSNWNITANRIFDNSEHGLYAFTCDDIIITDNEIYRSGNIGIYSMWGPRPHVEGNQVHESNNDGIMVASGHNGTIIGNNVTGSGNPSNGYNSFGIGAMGCNRVTFVDNDVSDTYGAGVAILGTGSTIRYLNISFNRAFYNLHGFGIYNDIEDSTIMGNLAYNNTVAGFSMTYTENCDITENGAFHNGQYGFALSGFVSYCMFTRNDVGWNTFGAVYEHVEDCLNNNWDHNLWSDYTGGGVYTVSSTSVDHYPSNSLELNMPESTLLEFALTGLTLEFGAFAIFPHSYRIHVGADPVEIEDWDGGNITFSLAGFSPGMYQISLTIIHFTMYSIDGIVSVIIVNSAPPEWTIIPTDQEINEGEAFSYQINATDLSGVAGYAVNDTVHFSIDSSGLITNATTLTSGVYWLNVTVVDIHGNEAFAVFKVTVVPIATTTTTTTTTTTQLPFDPLLLLAFGGGAVIVLIILVVILRRPRRE